MPLGTVEPVVRKLKRINPRFNYDELLELGLFAWVIYKDKNKSHPVHDAWLKSKIRGFILNRIKPRKYAALHPGIRDKRVRNVLTELREMLNDERDVQLIFMRCSGYKDPEIRKELGLSKREFYTTLASIQRCASAAIRE